MVRIVLYEQSTVDFNIFCTQNYVFILIVFFLIKYNLQQTITFFSKCPF